MTKRENIYYDFVEEVRADACQRAAELLSSGRVSLETVEKMARRWMNEEQAFRGINALLEACASDGGGGCGGGREETNDGPEK